MLAEGLCPGRRTKPLVVSLRLHKLSGLRTGGAVRQSYIVCAGIARKNKK
jgi:hypothetical protein